MLRKIIIILLFVFNGVWADYRYNLSICAIFQDEAPYLREWIEFHKLVGVEHFYLYNHLSKDNFEEILRPYLLSGFVELVDVQVECKDVTSFVRLQRKCYDECLQRAKGVSKWLAVIDIDEFLVPVKDQSLQTVLKEFENFAGVCPNWHIFGTSNVKKVGVNELLIEKLTLCSKSAYPANMHVKSIVRPEYTSHFLDAHCASYSGDYFQVNTDKMPFEGRFCPYIRNNKICINHYWTRDEDFFYNAKIPRQRRWGGDPKPEKILNATNATKDEMIQRFVPALKQAIQ